MPGTESTAQFNFVWNPPSGLSIFDERIFRIGLQLANRGLVYVKSDLNENGRVAINCSRKICGVARSVAQEGKRESATTYEMASALEDWQEMANDPHKKNYNVFPNTNLTQSFGGEECGHCGGHCPIAIAGYITYLAAIGRGGDVWKQRNVFATNQPHLDRKDPYGFSFTLETDRFLDLPEQVFEVAELLQERNYVSLERNIATDKNGRYHVIRFAKAIAKDSKYDDLQLLKKTLLSETLSRKPAYSYWVGEFAPGIKPFKTVILLAGYIDYLRRTNQYAAYRERRAAHLTDVAKSFGKSAEYNPALERVMDIAKSERETGLYCIIRGERGVGKREIIEQIARLLVQGNKIDSTDYKALSLVDPQLQAKDSPLNASNPFEPRKLYVFTDLEEFVYNTRQAHRGDGTATTQLIKHLGRYQNNTYIIIVDEHDQTEELLKTSPQIRFLFEPNVIPIRSLGPEEIYAAYLTKLSHTLANEASPEFRARFIQWCALNARMLPLANKELADYLASYANNAHELALPPDAWRDKSARDMLGNVIGLEKVKQTAYEFERYAIFHKSAQAEGIKMPGANMHMVFTGNPGTGKTMIARIMAKMLFDLGLVAKDNLVEVEAKDLIGPYVGDGANKTAEVISSAMGGVLFLDEAYSIGNNENAKQAIATLIKAMEDHKDEFVVIFAGYEHEMRDFLELNPGISSRIGYTFHFEDYSADELARMYSLKLRDAGFNIGDDVVMRVKTVCEHYSRRRNFGNGRFVDTLVQQTLIRRASREGAESIRNIEPDDVPSISDLAGADASKRTDLATRLEGVVGMEGVKSELHEFEALVGFQLDARRHGLSVPGFNRHMLFLGNPGTGKTMVARLVAQSLYDIGAIPENKLVEVERKDLIAGYIGQTAEKTSKVIDSALGGCLFIDEAYSLTPTDGRGFAAEAIATLIKAMEDHKDDLVVMFAGYEREMKTFVDSNPGIASRIGYTFHFEDYAADELLAIYVRKLLHGGFVVTEEGQAKALELMDYYRTQENFGNGRFVDKLIQRTMSRHALSYTADSISLIEEDDVPSIGELDCFA